MSGAQSGSGWLSFSGPAIILVVDRRLAGPRKFVDVTEPLVIQITRWRGVKIS